MGNRLITLEELKTYLGANKYNPDGSLEYEVIRFYTKEVIDGKTHIVVYDEPMQIKLEDGKWHYLVDVLDEEALAFLDPTPYDKNKLTHVIIDSDDAERFSPRRSELSPINKDDSFTEKVRGHLADHVWIDGASDTPGVIVLPYDFYDEVNVVTDPDNEGEVKVVPVKEYKEGMNRPYFKKEDGKTYIYVNHFSGGAGTQNDPYIVSTEEDLKMIYTYPTAWFVQDRDITIGGSQTGLGFWADRSSFTAFTGRYDGRNFAIRDLYINETRNLSTGLFPLIGNSAYLSRIRLVNVNIKSNNSNGTGALIGTTNNHYTNVSDCIVESGVVEGVSHVGGLIGTTNGTTNNIYITRSQSHCTVRGSGSYIGGFAGYFHYSYMVTYCLSTGKVEDSTIAQTATNIGAFFGYSTSTNTTTCIVDIESAGRANVTGGVHQYQTPDLKKTQTYVEHGWDFLWSFDHSDIRLNGGYPISRKWKKYQYGRGTPQDPFLIRTPDEFNQIRHYMYASFRLETDIDLGELSLTTEGFLPIGDRLPNTSYSYDGYSNSPYMGKGVDEYYFYGTLDGNGYTVGNFKINRDARPYTALFMWVADAHIKDLTIANASVKSANTYTAIFVGYGTSYFLTNRDKFNKFENITIKDCNLETYGTYCGIGFGNYRYSKTYDMLIENCKVTSNTSYAGVFAGAMHENVIIARTTLRGNEIMAPSYCSGFIAHMYPPESSTSWNDDIALCQIYDLYVDTLLPASGGHVSAVTNYFYRYQKNSNATMYEGKHLHYLENWIILSRRRNGVALPFASRAWSITHNFTNANYATNRNLFYDRNLTNYASVHDFVQPKYKTELINELFYESLVYKFDFENTWSISATVNDGYPQLTVHIPPKLPSLGFRNAFGNYFTDERGNILRYLEFGTSVAGTTSKVMPIWIQNNSEFAVNNLQVWIDENTLKEGINAEISFTENPFVAEDKLNFPGTLGVGASQRLFVRYDSAVTVKEGGTFDLRAKASPTF